MFNKNLEFLDNIALKRRLLKLDLFESRTGIAYCVTPSGDYVLIKDDIPSDDLQNPRETIRNILKKNIRFQMYPNDIIIAFGIGLGYLLDEIYNEYPSKIFIYEPDLKLLHFVLNNVDISEHLKSGRVFITNDLDELISKLNTTFLTKDKVEIVYLPNYAIVKNKELLLLTQKVLDACKSKMIDINTIVKFSKLWLDNTIDNITFINSRNAYLLSDLSNKYVGSTALVLGAGPSLNDNIKNIIDNRDKFTIFSINKNIQYLLKNNIKPDFVVCLDAENMERTLDCPSEYLSDICAIADIRTDSFIWNKNFKKIFFNFSESDMLMKTIAKYNKKLAFNESGGSSSTLALMSAVKMGFSKVVLAGVDLAFKDNVIYTYGEMMQKVSSEQIIVDKIVKNLVQVKSVKGNFVTTRDDYKTILQHFEELIKELNYTEIYNITSFGALIKGVKNVSFQDLDLKPQDKLNIVDTMEPFRFELKEFFDEEFYNINNIISFLSKGIFSPALVSSIVTSSLVYQYMQSKILQVLQNNFAPELASSFIEDTKISIKTIVDHLQKNKLI